MSKKTKTTKLLRRGKFYKKAKNEVCSLCNNGFGCCKTHSSIYFQGSDFDMDFTDKDAVRALLGTNLFTVSITVRDYSEQNSVTIYLRKRSVERYRDVCVFWDTKGCVLKHDIRPSICRYQTCHNIGDTIEYNRSDVDDAGRYKKKHFSYDEILTILEIMKELELTNKRTIPKRTFAKIDMKQVLRVL